MVVVVEKGGCIEHIGGATCQEGEVGSEDVVDSAAEDARDCKGCVESGEGVVGGGVVDLASTTHPGEGIEHAGTTETNQAYDDCQKAKNTE